MSRKIFALAALAFVLLALGCADAADPITESVQGAIDEAPAPQPPPAPPPSPDWPAGICDAVEKWCPSPDYWPRDEVMGSYPGVTQFCFCRCDPNLGSPGPTCSLSPLPSDCGALMDQVTNPDGSLGFKEKFPHGYPNLCRYSMAVPAQ